MHASPVPQAPPGPQAATSFAHCPGATQASPLPQQALPQAVPEQAAVTHRVPCKA
jgi:hypothetical protein